MAEGDQDFTVSGALLNGDVPFGGDRGQNVQGLRRVGPCQVGEMTEGAAVVQVICRVMGGKRHGLERERGYDQKQDRERL
jgi:hypothetical protein